MPGDSTLIVTTQSGVRPLGVRGEPLHNSAPQLRRVVRRRLGDAAADLLAERIGLTLPEDRDYATVAGLALAELRRLPAVGDHFDFGGYRFEIVDMDGRKIDKLLVAVLD